MNTVQKPWWRSRTIWLNLLVATFLLAEANLDAMQGIFPDWLQKTLVFGLPIVNLWLRFATSQGLSFKPQMPTGAKDGE
jgi:hypothetical protein